MKKPAATIHSSAVWLEFLFIWDFSARRVRGGYGFAAQFSSMAT
jgi:hypothetical protein